MSYVSSFLVCLSSVEGLKKAQKSSAYLHPLICVSPIQFTDLLVNAIGAQDTWSMLNLVVLKDAHIISECSPDLQSWCGLSFWTAVPTRLPSRQKSFHSYLKKKRASSALAGGLKRAGSNAWVLPWAFIWVQPENERKSPRRRAQTPITQRRSLAFES